MFVLRLTGAAGSVAVLDQCLARACIGALVFLLHGGGGGTGRKMEFLPRDIEDIGDILFLRLSGGGIRRLTGKPALARRIIDGNARLVIVAIDAEGNALPVILYRISFEQNAACDELVAVKKTGVVESY